MPFHAVSSTHPSPKVARSVWGQRRNKDNVFPTVNLYTYLQCALRGLVQAGRSVRLQTVRTY